MHSLKDICGVRVSDELSRSAAESSAAHAYIFEGAKGLGKRRAALCFAAALICDTHSGEPCGMCDNCIQAFGKNNPDIISISLDTVKKKSIGVDDIRDVIADVYIRPFKSDKKIYIIEDGDALTAEAQNAMLKILEEPPHYAAFIICTTNIGFILPTVVSRSRSVHFTGFGFSEQKAYIEQNYPGYSKYSAFCAGLCRESRDMVDNLLSDAEFYDKIKRVCDYTVDFLTSSDEEKVFEFAEFFEGKKDGAEIEPELCLNIMQLACAFLLRIRQTGNYTGNEVLMSGDAAMVLLKVSSKKLAYASERIEIALMMLKRHLSKKMIALNLAENIYRY